MFSIDSNALNQTRFVVHPLKPINLSTPFDSTESQSPGETTRISDSDSDSNQSGDVQLEDDEPDVWTVKASEGIAKNSTFSWDAPVRGPPTRSAFLSEQSARVFVAARFHVQPRLISDGDAVRRFISPADLLSSLRTTLLGGTSQLFSWDERDAQHAVRVENNEFGQTILVLGELSEETTSSLIAPLLEIGTLIRRIENTILELRRPSTAAASRALAYSLQSIISLIQSELTTRLPETLTMASLSRLSTSFNDLRFELTTLAELCHCKKPLNESPPFAELPSTQTSLLDHLFLALDHAISHSAPYRTSAMIAYLLVTSSQDFNDSLAVTIGLVLRSSRPAKSLVSGHKIDLPSFFSERSKLVLGSAARALDILRRADPEHPLCRTDWAWKGPGWGWFDKDLHAVDALTQKHILNVRKTLNGLYGAAYAITSPVESEDNENETHSITSKDGISPSSEPTETTTSVPSPSEPVRVYKPEIATFSVFDQPPGSHIPAPIKDISVAQFISNGPRVLPLSAPTLPLLLDVSLLALPLAHSRLISSALFRVFTGRLAFKAHLKVLRGFLLGDDAKFWSRLRGALFEEAGIPHVSAAVGRGIRAGVRVRLGIADTTRDNMADERAEREGRSREWGVGLAVGLSDREGAGTWPPGGAELGLRLRHVIDDTLGVGWGIASTSDSDDEESETARERGPERIVLKETPWRLGFILRDLEEESPEGRARWLNPNVYGAILTAGPVETVTRILFNTIFQEEGPDNPPVLLMARFKIQSFISSLIGYVKDMAIGFHWDSFLAKLDEIEREDESKSESTLPRDLKKERMASDIFAVHSHLSNTMDQILESCLLRARQRAVGNALKECMEAVLVLGKLVGDRCRQHSSSFQDETYEKQFVLNVAKVLRRFDRLHNALIAALRALDLKGVSIAAGAGPLSTDDIQLLRRQEGESEGIYGRMATWLDPAARCTKPKTTTV
ncbi:Spc97 / Spc98 family, partial [Rhizoctonia solani]